MNAINQLESPRRTGALVVFLEWKGDGGRVSRISLTVPEAGETQAQAPGLTVRAQTGHRDGQPFCRVELTARGRVEIRRAEVRSGFEAPDTTVSLLNGYQSWTPTEELDRRSRMTGLGFLGRLLKSIYSFEAYGDYRQARYGRRRGRFHGYTYGFLRSGPAHLLAASCSEAEGFTRIEVRWTGPGRGTLAAVRECQGLVLEPGRSWKALDLGFFSGTGDQVFDDWFAAQRIGPRTLQTRKGWTSWYRHYQNISEPVLQKDLAACRTHAPFLDVFQIDDGWQEKVGDWDRVDWDRFPRGLEPLAQEIRQAGFVPGLWLAPFAAQQGSRLVADHPDWLLKDRRGRPVPAGHNWGRFWALDPEHPGVRTWLAEVFGRIRDEWGFGLFKLDFLYAACLAPPADKTAGQVMDESMAFLRTLCGDSLMLACGVPLASAFGRADYCRIGCDVGLDWDDKVYMQHTFRERVSTKNALGSMVHRRQLNGRAFLNDPDVWIRREDPAVSLTGAQKQQLYESATTYGGLSFTSDDLSTLDPLLLSDWRRRVLPPAQENPHE